MSVAGFLEDLVLGKLPNLVTADAMFVRLAHPLVNRALVVALPLLDPSRCARPGVFAALGGFRAIAALELSRLSEVRAPWSCCHPGVVAAANQSFEQQTAAATAAAAAVVAAAAPTLA